MLVNITEGQRFLKKYLVSTILMELSNLIKHAQVFEQNQEIVRCPYGKAVFVRISDEYAANILRTALFTVIVRYIFTSCRKYPANKVGLTKK